ncbi:uncharacterized protein LOC115053421 isoform X2 [Echeneis naucrates]|uniref:uncharacterized protein LOC115053421 isoform X2 n=1 Tax=Echeneis naucrates TaxID=173247 RepID=UPI0011142BA8|nr:uncharacterized protein LOC115053421 isoform X2 [Echeneis naucrates]
MKVDKWLFLLALCFTCVSSNEEQHDENSCEMDMEYCETHTLSVQLGSSVLLPCNFKNSNNSNWVSWKQMPESEQVVQLTSEGRIHFLQPRNGRVKTFPNQGSNGNFSILIDELQDPDLGCYSCKQADGCFQLELVVATDTLRGGVLLLIYIAAGIVGFILLCICCCLFYFHKSRSNSIDIAVTDIQVITAPPGILPVQERPRGIHNDLVYENDDQDPVSQLGDPTRTRHILTGGVFDQPTQSVSVYPSLNDFNFERVESTRTKLRFHREFINRFRQASFSHHHYVNQSELSRQQAASAQAESHQQGFGKRQAKQKNQYNNPIYNRSTEQLNRP